MTDYTVDPQFGRLSYSVRRYFVDEYYSHQVSRLPSGSRVLDIGGHKTRKRGQFDVRRYDLDVTYVNIEATRQPDAQAEAAHLPFADTCFDAAICAELLEHVPDPKTVLGETFRILRKGGIILLTVPFLYHIHADPYDFGRYTNQYWRCTLQEIGFQDLVIERQGLFYSVLADFLKQRANRLNIPKPFGRVSRWLMTRLFIAPLQRWGFRREQRRPVQSDPFIRSFTTGFGVRGTKA